MVVNKLSFETLQFVVLGGWYKTGEGSYTRTSSNQHPLQAHVCNEFKS